MGFGYALTNWNSMTDTIKFVGLDNFRTIFATGEYLKYISNTVVFTVVTSIFEAVIGISLALVLNTHLKSKNILRSIFFLPQTVAPLIIGLIFSSIFAPSGIINDFLKMIGLGAFTHSWLTETKFAMPAVMSVEVWRWAGLNMVIFLAGLQIIPKAYYEAASIDGASRWQKFKNITVPYIIPAVTINTVLNAIHGLKVFDIIFSLTNGGPGTVTEVLSTSVYREYGAGHYGLSTALNLVMFILTTVVACTLQVIISKREVEV